MVGKKSIKKFARTCRERKRSYENFSFTEGTHKKEKSLRYPGQLTVLMEGNIDDKNLTGRNST